MTLYYDPFDVQEEEEFMDIENERNRLKIRNLISELDVDNDDATTTISTPKTISVSFPLDHKLLVQLLNAVVTFCRRMQEQQRQGQGQGQHQHYSSIAEMSFSHLRYAGALELAKCIQELGALSSACCLPPQRLSLAGCCCGTNGIQAILSSLSSYSPSSSMLYSLDLSRNNLRTLDPSILLEVLPKLPHLKILILAGTGLNGTLVNAIMTILRRPHTIFTTTTTTANDTNTSCCNIETLDISNNFDSLKDLFEECHIIDHFLKSSSSSSSCSLKRLILTNGANSSTCLDYQDDDDCHIIKRLEETIMNITMTMTCNDNDNTSLTSLSSLQFLGPLALLPLDRQSAPSVHQQYQNCRQSLERIEYYLARNRLFQNVLATTATATTAAVTNNNNKKNNNNNHKKNNDKGSSSSSSRQTKTTTTPIEHVLPDLLARGGTFQLASSFTSISLDAASPSSHNNPNLGAITTSSFSSGAFAAAATPPPPENVVMSLQYVLLRETLDRWI